MSMNLSDPKDIVQSAQQINKLRQLLAWDIAAAITPTATVQLQLQTPRSQMPVQLWLSASDLELFLTEEIEKTLNRLLALGVDTAPILSEYRAAAATLALQQATTEQNPS